MKKIVLSIFSVLSAFVIMAQVPQALNYQAVARNNVGQIVPSQNIGVRFSIHDGTANGTIIYQETHTTATNNFGLFTLAIGRGTVVSGTFNSINWGTGDKFLQVEIAPAGGNNYTVQGTTQFLSVPYSLYSAKTNLIAGNNTIVVANGTTITGNYQPANNTIVINGNTIAGNYQAGTGITIAGNTISATASTLWVSDANGIHNQSGNVGIRVNSDPNVSLDIVQSPQIGASAGLRVRSSTDTWHTAFVMLNTTSGANNQYSFSLGGSGNIEIGPRNFGIMNHNSLTWAFKINGANNNIGIGMLNITNSEVPRSRLHVFSGDINIDQIGSGIIIKSPNGQCWRITIDNSGNLVRTSITCP